MQIRKVSISLLTALMGVYLGVSGVASTLNDVNARVLVVTAIYWLVITIINWVPDKVKQVLVQPEIVVGVMLIINNYIILGQTPYLKLLPLQLILLWLVWWLNRDNLNA